MRLQPCSSLTGALPAGERPDSKKRLRAGGSKGIFRVRRQRSSSLSRSCGQLGGLNGFHLGSAVHFLLAGLANINAALEVSAVFDADALADHVAGKRAFVADVHAVTGSDVALHFAEDDEFLRVHVG